MKRRQLDFRRRLTGACHGVALVRAVDGAPRGRGRPLTTRFVQRQPRLTKPMELRKNLGIAWENSAYRNEKSVYLDNTRHLQFGINTIVFALIQEGSITNRVMEIVR